MEDDKLKEIFNRAENEDIAQAIEEKAPEILEKILALLPSVRRQIVENLLQQQSGDKAKSMASQTKILKIYRSMQKDAK
jgi:flagellar motor switch protein FliG